MFEIITIILLIVALYIVFKRVKKQILGKGCGSKDGCDGCNGCGD